MEKPSLVILAAGMGSRYGGLKQIDPIDKHGNKIIDFSIYDAIRAGFKKVVFIIKRENEQDFRSCIGDTVSRYIDVEYVFQDLNNVPQGFVIPEGRVKPWGTAHAILCCKDVIDGPFAVINSDDYYGQSAFQTLYDFLTTHEDDTKYRYAMVGYELGNTLTDNGYVSRGCCITDQNGFLVNIAERTHIEKTGTGAAYTEDDGATWNEIPAGSIVSMNMWGFQKSLMEELKKGFPEFLKANLDKNPLKCEYFLPFAVDDLIQEGKATVQVLKTDDKWYGVTYKEDKAFVVKAIQSLKDSGLYPQELWEEQ